MTRYNIYGIGAALVDTEVEVSDTFLANASIDKGVMTLVDEARQSELLAALASENSHLVRKCGGSVCNSVVAASSLGASTFFSGKVADDADGGVEDAGCASTPTLAAAELVAVHLAGWRARQTKHRQLLLEAPSASRLAGMHGGQKNYGRRERLRQSWLQWSWSSRCRLPRHESLGPTTLLITRSTDGASRQRVTDCQRPNAKVNSRRLSRLP